MLQHACSTLGGFHIFCAALAASVASQRGASVPAAAAKVRGPSLNMRWILDLNPNLKGLERAPILLSLTCRVDSGLLSTVRVCRWRQWDF